MILLVLLLVTRLCGELAERVKQPPLVGELVAGVALGVVASRNHEALPILANLPENEIFGAITDLAIFFLMLLAVLTAVLRTGGFPDFAAVALLAGKVVAYFLVTWLIGQYAVPRLGRLVRKTRAQEFELSALLILALGLALLAEALGMHFILGAFMAGLFFGRKTVSPEGYESIRSSLTSITMGFFAPLFFASVGLQLDLSAAVEIPLLVTPLVLAAFIGKLVGAGAPAYATGFDLRESAAIGVAMSARGAVELIIAGIALQAGLFGHPDPTPPVVKYLFSAIVIMAMVTTLLTPMALRPLLGGHQSN